MTNTIGRTQNAIDQNKSLYKRNDPSLPKKNPSNFVCVERLTYICASLPSLYLLIQHMVTSLKLSGSVSVVERHKIAQLSKVWKECWCGHDSLLLVESLETGTSEYWKSLCWDSKGSLQLRSDYRKIQLKADKCKRQEDVTSSAILTDVCMTCSMWIKLMITRMTVWSAFHYKRAIDYSS